MRLKRLSALRAAFFIVAATTAAFSHAEEPRSLSLNQLVNLEFHPEGAADGISKDNKMRYTALMESALAAGGQHGFYARMQLLKEGMDDYSAELDSIFDFGVLMKLASAGEEEMFFLPPVIREAENIKSLSASQNTVRVSGKYFEIERPARLTLRPPNWRQYLIFDQELYLSRPPKALMPKTDEEKKLWKKYVEAGWKEGQAQAEEEMAFRVERLGEDFVGMIKYMRLVMSGQIKAPYVAILKDDVVADRDTMRIDERVYKIAIPAAMESDTSKWNPLYGDDRDSLVYPAESQVIRAARERYEY